MYELLVVILNLGPINNVMSNVMWSHETGMKEVVVIVLEDAGIGC